MRFLLYFFLLFPLFTDAQSVALKINKAEKELEYLNLKQDSLYRNLEVLKFEKIQEDLQNTGLPATPAGEEVVYHTAYALLYSEQDEQAKWVAHIILPDVNRGNEGRSNDFRPDLKIKTGSATETDYFLKTMLPDSSYKYDGFGYDRGHLAPSADFRYSKKALSESYLYSNMSPQMPGLNRGRWAEMEDLVRQYVIRNGNQVYVVTGPVLKKGLKKIDRAVNAVSIPEYFYKVVLDEKQKRGIGFIMPNTVCDYPVMHYAVTIDSVESLTGIDFFYKLPDTLENRIESVLDIKSWVGEKALGDVLPIRADMLPKNTFNTIQARYYSGRNENVRICGTVVSTKLSSKGNIFLNLDKQFPNQIFSISIFKDKVPNFSYQPDTFLSGKTICVTGKITDNNGVPGVSIDNEKAIEILAE